MLIYIKKPGLSICLLAKNLIRKPPLLRVGDTDQFSLLVRGPYSKGYGRNEKTVEQNERKSLDIRTPILPVHSLPIHYRPPWR